VTSLTPKEAVALQRELAGRVVTEGEVDPIELVAGVDIGVRGGLARAAVTVFSFPELELVEQRTAVRPLEFPYVPGLLAFRELPAILEACSKLEHDPSLIFTDGHGYCHPRRFGIACYLGVELDKPTIGVGKSRLIGQHREPGEKRGAKTQVTVGKELVGFYVRTRDSVKPVYVSVGHRVGLDFAVKSVLRCTSGYRLPEPIRAADRMAGSMDEEGRVPAR